MGNQVMRCILIVIVSLLLAGCDGTIPAALVRTTPGVEPTYPSTATTEDFASVELPTEMAALAEQALPLAATLPPASESDPAQPVFAGQVADQPCDLISPGMPIDVTVPDGSRYLPGENFSKTWRLVNSGSCPWTREYAIVWFSGEPMGVDEQWYFVSDVKPGETVDVTVDMVAPMQSGDFQSNWKLMNSQGELFGLGPNGDAPLWVIIQVKAENTATVLVEPTLQPTPAVYVSGIINLVKRDGLDLDTGEVNLEGDIDLRYEASDSGDITLVPENEASAALFGDFEPAKQDCQQSTMKTAPLVVKGAETGVYVCYYTTQGLPGFAHVISVGEDGQMLALDYVTWTVP